MVRSCYGDCLVKIMDDRDGPMMLRWLSHENHGWPWWFYGGPMILRWLSRDYHGMVMLRWFTNGLYGEAWWWHRLMMMVLWWLYDGLVRLSLWSWVLVQRTEHVVKKSVIVVSYNREKYKSVVNVIGDSVSLNMPVVFTVAKNLYYFPYYFMGK